MKSTITSTNSEEWLRILDKGMVTIPKVWREELGLSKGEIVRARKQGNSVIIESQQEQVPYRVYSSHEVAEFVRNDRLPKKLKAKVSESLRTPKSD